MAPVARPIPAFYAVYFLRSSKKISFYIGSTPDPVRRLKQHNGTVRGGASRTARGQLRPWEMMGLVSGFPSSVAALQFEWALNNPHLSLHIPSSSRISFAKKSRRGRPRRPRATLASILQNVHLLLRVPSFARWPLRLHFFARDAHDAWLQWCAGGGAAEPLRDNLPVLTDFAPETGHGSATAVAGKSGRKTKAATATAEQAKAAKGAARAASSSSRSRSRSRSGSDSWSRASSLSSRLSAASSGTSSEAEAEAEAGGDEEAEKPAWGIHALAVDYEPLKEYVAKGQAVFEFERQGDCVVCHEPIDDEGLHAVCSNEGCEGVGHLTCWAGHFLADKRLGGGALSDGDGDGPVLPSGTLACCPRCGRRVESWDVMMRELTLRARGERLVHKLLKAKKGKKRKAAER